MVGQRLKYEALVAYEGNCVQGVLLKSQIRFARPL